MNHIKIEFTNERIVPSKFPNGYVPVDIDVTPFDNFKTRKEGVSRTYKGYDGYAPIMAYIGTEGYLVNAQLREGKQHCQCGTPAFLRETIALCRQITDEPLLIRLDTGNDSAENIGILLESGCYFIIKRNPRRESKDGWFEMAKANSQNITIPREGKTVYTGSDWKPVTYTTVDGVEKNVTIRTGYEIIERTEACICECIFSICRFPAINPNSLTEISYPFQGGSMLVYVFLQ